MYILASELGLAFMQLLLGLSLMFCAQNELQNFWFSIHFTFFLLYSQISRNVLLKSSLLTLFHKYLKYILRILCGLND